MPTITEKTKDSFEALKGNFGYTNRQQSPHIEKVVISVGVGRVNKDKKRLELIENRLATICGQRAARRPAKKSIASFKTREGDIVGFQITLRGSRARGFLEKFFNVVLPRTRDFRGILPSIIDDMGNLTIGVREHTIFPETADEDIKDVFGLSVTLVSTAHNKEEARAYFEYLEVPFVKTI